LGRPEKTGSKTQAKKRKHRSGDCEERVTSSDYGRAPAWEGQRKKKGGGRHYTKISERGKVSPNAFDIVCGLDMVHQESLRIDC